MKQEMKQHGPRTFRIMILMLMLLAGTAALPGPAAADDLLDQAFREAVSDILEALPIDTHVRLIAVTDITGDDGRLARYLTETLKASRHFILVERNQLEHLIKEQGFQMSDLVNPAERIDPGGIKGVEGIIFGKILRAHKGPLSADVRVFLQMDDVQSGKILMAREFFATVHAPHRETIIGLATMAAALFFLVLWIRRRTRIRAADRQQDAWKNRTAMTGDLNRISEVLQEVRGAVFGESSRDAAASAMAADISSIDFEMGRIKDRITSGRWGQGMGKDARSLAKADKTMDQAINDARRTGEKLLEACRENNFEKTGRLVTELKKQIADISAVIHQRT